MLEVISQDYIRTAARQGAARALVVYKHALRNMMVPLLTIIGIFVAIALTGHRAHRDGVHARRPRQDAGRRHRARDYPLAQGAITVFTMIIIVVNLVVDLMYAVVDPRITSASREPRRLDGRRSPEPIRSTWPVSGRRGAAGTTRGRLRRWLPISIGLALAMTMIVVAAAAPLIRAAEPVGPVLRCGAEGAGGDRSSSARHRRVRPRPCSAASSGDPRLARGRAGLGGFAFALGVPLGIVAGVIGAA